MTNILDRLDINTPVYFASLKKGAVPVPGIILDNTERVGSFLLYKVELSTGERITLTRTQLFLDKKDAWAFIDEHKNLT